MNNKITRQGIEESDKYVDSSTQDNYAINSIKNQGATDVSPLANTEKITPNPPYRLHYSRNNEFPLESLQNHPLYNVITEIVQCCKIPTSLA